MDPLEQMLTDLGEPAERGLEFGLDPRRVREVLATLVKADPLLWFKHLLQLLYDVPLEEGLRLTRQGSKGLLLEIVPCSSEVLTELSLERIHSKETGLLGQGRDARMARLLCELPGDSLLRHQDFPGLALHVGKDRFEIRDPGCGRGPGTPERGLSLEFPVKALMIWGRLYGYAPLTIARTMHYLCGLQPSTLRVEDVDPLPPEWPFPLPVVQGDDDMLSMWDWESVVPAERDGFLWAVSAWGETLEGPGDSGGENPVGEGPGEVGTVGEASSPGGAFPSTIVRHPMESMRTFSQLPMLGCYPASLASHMSLDEAALEPRRELRVARVFGVSWTSSAPKSSELYPIFRGVPGTAIPLEGAPAGLYLLVEASHLRTDASGVALVRDEAGERWIAEQVAWAREQTRLYAPYQTEIPRLWMQRVKTRDEIGRRPGVRQRLWKGALSALYATGPVRRIIERRRKALTEWATAEDDLES